MKMRQRVSLIFCILILQGMGAAHAMQTPARFEERFAQGNTEYQKGNYPSAEQFYHQILDSGVESGPLYFNLGNACFKQKKLGEAIYYWEKARQILPADRDIQENLELANLLIVDRIETSADPFPLRILKWVQALLTTTQEGLLVLSLFICANALFFVFLIVKNPRYSLRALISSFVIGFLCLVFACSYFFKIYEKDYRKKGVVIEQKVDVRSGPGIENITVFTIHEGIKVQVHELSNGWYQISLPNGWSGWLQQGYIRIL
jgi:tetratricopeptide (TPR) repeat protein